MKELTIELDSAREVMYDDLADKLGDANVTGDLEDTVVQRLTQLYDNREEIEVRE